MNKIFLIMYFGSTHAGQYIKIHPFKWFLTPRKKRDYKNSRSHNKFITAYSPGIKNTSLDLAQSMSLIIRYKVSIKINFLCLSISFRKWQIDEDVKRIYGLNYDYRTETFEGAREKMSALTDTGYFS